MAEVYQDPVWYALRSILAAALGSGGIVLIRPLFCPFSMFSKVFVKFSALNFNFPTGFKLFCYISSSLMVNIKIWKHFDM